MKLRTFLGSLLSLPLLGCAIPVVGNSPEEIKHRKLLQNSTKFVAAQQLKVGNIVKWNDWKYYKGKEHYVRLSVVTCAWNDGSVLLDDHRGIHSSELTKIGHWCISRCNL